MEINLWCVKPNEERERIRELEISIVPTVQNTNFPYLAVTYSFVSLASTSSKVHLDQ